MTRALQLVTVALLAGCSSSVRPGLELTLYDGPVDCAENGGCTVGGQPVFGEEHRVRALVGERGDGLQVQARWARPAGALAVLDLRVPLGAAPASAPQVLYSEVSRDGRVLFSAGRAWGRVEVGIDPGCPCQTGRLEVLLTDPGPDGAFDTGDDLVRRISRARLRRDGRPFCHPRETLAIRAGYLVAGLRACPAGGTRAGGVATCVWGGAGWVGGGWNDDGWYDETWTGDWEEAGSEPPGETEEDWGDWTQESGVDEGWYDDGSYDDGSYDDGSYDDGSYDDGSYDDGSYDDGSYDDSGWDDGGGDSGTDGSSSDFV